MHLYNHVDIILSYNDESIISKGSFSIVQFEVVPRSVQYDLSAWPKGEACPQATQQPVLIRGGGESASCGREGEEARKEIKGRRRSEVGFSHPVIPDKAR